jgi:hypothetical protein
MVYNMVPPNHGFIAYRINHERERCIVNRAFDLSRQLTVLILFGRFDAKFKKQMNIQHDMNIKIVKVCSKRYNDMWWVCIAIGPDTFEE